MFNFVKIVCLHAINILYLSIQNVENVVKHPGQLSDSFDLDLKHDSFNAFSYCTITVFRALVMHDSKTQ